MKAIQNTVLKKYFKTIFAVIGISILLNGLFMLIFANYNLGILLTLLLGLFISACGIFGEKIVNLTNNGILKYIRSIILILVVLELLLLGFLAIYGVSDNVNYKEDALIVMGAGIRGDKITYPLLTRLNKAVEYHNKNKNAVIVVSGGQGPQETVTEAYAMKQYLLECGIPENKIIMEEKATSSDENIRFSKKILDDFMKKDYSIIVVTNNFHIYRTVQTAKANGFSSVGHISSGIQFYNILPCFLRESLAVLYMWFFG